MAKSKEEALLGSTRPGLFACRFVQSSGILRLKHQVHLASPAKCLAPSVHARAHGQSKEAVLLASTSGLEEHGISLRSSEPNLKYKTKFKEREFGKVGAAQVQTYERPNPSFKRTRLRRSA